MLTLNDLRALCNALVPPGSRHPRSREGWQASITGDRYVPEVDTYWHAHEIGHLLIALPEENGEPEYVLGSSSGLYITHALVARRAEAVKRVTVRIADDADMLEIYARACELAAMDISRRLLAAAGRGDLHVRERADTARETLEFDDRGAVRGLLRLRGVERLPHDRDGLARMMGSALDR